MSRETSLLQQEQVERLMQIGAYLRHIREENGFSLEDVATRTLIQTRSIKAIEEGKLHQLPEPVYVQGFIRRYAEAMGLDGAEFAEAFPAERSLPIDVSWKDLPAAQLRPLHLYIAYIALIMASVSLLSYIVGRSVPSQTESSSPTLQVSPANLGNAVASPEARSLAARPSPTQSVVPDKPVRVDIKLTGQSWLEVEVDGEVKLAEVLSEGTERTWTADRQVRVRAGNAGGVTIAHNGGKSEPMGVPGAVEEKTYAPTATTNTRNATSAPDAAAPNSDANVNN
ncbi:MAG: DUF4115 domain-containing protein [Elainella sp. Prado103]|nr:DUF4115 domain-containing protein [Elainella sp. Prado103]